MMSPEEPTLNEVASIERDTSRHYFGNTLTHEDDTLKTRGLGRGYAIYDELKRDAHVSAVLHKRKMAVTSRRWKVTPASNAPLDVEAARVVRLAIERVRFNKLCKALLDATVKGFAVAEVIWESADGLVLPRAIKPKRQERFRFNLREELRLLTREHPVDGEAVPERKFIVHTCSDDEGGPYGLGVGHVIFWPVYFKRQGITFWLSFVDKFGSPTAVGKYPAGATAADRTKLLGALRAIAQDAGIVVPQGMEVTLLEAARVGSIDTYEKLCRYMDEQISVAVLGETMSTTTSVGGQGGNQAHVHNEVRKEVAQDDSNELCDTLNTTLVKWIVDYNVPGAEYPTLTREFTTPQDLNTLAQRDTKLASMGFEPTADYIRERYGEGWTKKGQVAPPSTVEGAAQMVSFAETASVLVLAKTLVLAKIAAARRLLPNVDKPLLLKDSRKNV